MNITLLKGYPDLIGKREAFVGFGSGPSSYLQSTGDPLVSPKFQFFFDAVFSAMSVSKTYYVRFYPSGTGARQTWIAKWYVVATGAETADAVNLSAEKVQIGGFGGSY